MAPSYAAMPFIPGYEYFDPVANFYQMPPPPPPPPCYASMSYNSLAIPDNFEVLDLSMSKSTKEN